MTDAAAIYEAAGIGGGVRRGARPGVLVIDFNLGFTDPACAVGSDLTGPVLATRRLLDVAREHAVPVVFTTIAFDRAAEASSPWLQKMPGLLELEIGSRWVEIDPRLDRRPEEPVVLKKGASGFFGSALASTLVGRDVDTVVLCGATTSGCVRATAVDLVQYGWPTLVPRECVGDRAQAPHEANLFDIQAKYADVVSLDDALGYLREAGGDPAAR
ncbi:MAG: maleamate amidohydrolase [Solirubrobacteraceae bacterium]|nr:maleamate amidohydrolase [Solirubrobacteraceae bacterium]